MIEPPRFTEAGPVTAAVIPIVVARTRIGEVMAPAIREVMGTVRAQGLQPAGAVFSHHARLDPEVFDFEVGVPVASDVQPAGRVRPGTLPTGRIARTVYQGPYEGLNEAWEAFDDWIVAQGEVPGTHLWECYLSGPESGAEPALWRTELNRTLGGPG